MVPIKNATAVIKPQTQIPDAAGLLGNPQQAGVDSCSVYFEETTPAEMFVDSGLNLAQPAFLQAEIADAAKFRSEAIVVITMAGQTQPYRAYAVKGVTERHFAANDADHCDVYLDFLLDPPL